MVQAQNEAEAITMIEETEVLLLLFPEIIDPDVIVTNMAGLYANQGAEHAWVLLLSLARGISCSTDINGRKFGQCLLSS